MSIHPLLLPASFLFALHQLAQKWWQLSFPFADHYLDPLLCTPILFGVWQWEQQLLYKRSIAPTDFWVATAVLSILFEVGFPYFSPKFTADWNDVILYFMGTALFLLTTRTYGSTKKQDLLQEV